MSRTSADQHSDAARTLGLDPSSGRGRRWKRWLAGIVLMLAAGLVLASWNKGSKGPAIQYKTQPAQRDSLAITVTATGNLEPTKQVEVGSELSGIVESVAVDYNDHVKVGQILAKLDTSKVNDQALQSKASLASARAQILSSQATITETKQQLARYRKLKDEQVVSQQEVDAAQASFDRAVADAAKARAAADQSQALLRSNETDLAKTIIRSPINGVVLTRSIDPGQTVAASLQAPVLFLLAEDLTKMELHVDVDEADVGQVKEAQQAVFTVDAYPDRKFPARITHVRYGSKTVNGVVTYETVLNVDNSDLSLRPGMTGTAYITVKKIDNAIVVPNAALRFTPPPDATAAQSGGSVVSKIFPHPPSAPAKKKVEVNADKKQQAIWTLRDGRLTSIAVTLGSTDGTKTEITKGDVEAGTELVVSTSGATQ